MFGDKMAGYDVRRDTLKNVHSYILFNISDIALNFIWLLGEVIFSRRRSSFSWHFVMRTYRRRLSVRCYKTEDPRYICHHWPGWHVIICSEWEKLKRVGYFRRDYMSGDECTWICCVCLFSSVNVSSYKKQTIFKLDNNHIYTVWIADMRIRFWTNYSIIFKPYACLFYVRCSKIEPYHIINNDNAVLWEWNPQYKEYIYY